MMIHKTFVTLAGLFMVTNSFAFDIGTIQILKFNGEDKVLTEGFESEKPINWTSDRGEGLLEGIKNSTYDLIFIHADKLDASILEDANLKISDTLAANAIGLFVPNKTESAIGDALQSAEGNDPIPSLVETFIELDLKLHVNNLRKLREVTETLKTSYNLPESFLVNENRRGMDAVRTATNINQASIMGLHPALRQQGFSSSVFTIDSKHFYVPIVAVYRSTEGEALVNHILSTKVQNNLEKVRNQNYPDLAIWKSGISYENLAPRSATKLACNSYTITEDVPRYFAFKFENPANLSEVTGISDFGQGLLTCDEQSEKLVCAPKETNEPAAVEFYFDAIDPDKQGKILRGFSAEGFFIGAGGWNLKCKE